MAINGDNGKAASTELQSPLLLTREEAMERLRVRSSHFSKLVAGKVRGLRPLPSIRLGRRQLFKEASLSAWIAEVEGERC